MVGSGSGLQYILPIHSGILEGKEKEKKVVKVWWWWECSPVYQQGRRFPCIFTKASGVVALCCWTSCLLSVSPCCQSTQAQNPVLWGIFSSSGNRGVVACLCVVLMRRYEGCRNQPVVTLTVWEDVPQNQIWCNSGSSPETEQRQHEEEEEEVCPRTGLMASFAVSVVQMR